LDDHVEINKISASGFLVDGKQFVNGNIQKAVYIDTAVFFWSINLWERKVGKFKFFCLVWVCWQKDSKSVFVGETRCF